MFGLFYFDWTMLIVLPALIFSLWAQFKVNSTFEKYSKLRTRRGITGADAARRVLNENGLYDVKIENCTSLTSVTIPNSVMSIGNTAFENCTNLTSITIPDSVTDIVGSVFAGCISLRSVYLTDLESWLKLDFASVQSSPFYYGADLYLNNVLVTELIIPDSISDIGFGAFYGCTSITTITIPDSVTSIGASAFRNCSNLSSIYIGNGVTSIGGFALANCSSLTSITVGNDNQYFTSINGNLYSKDGETLIQ